MMESVLKLGIPDRLTLFLFGYTKADIASDYNPTHSRRFNISNEDIGEQLNTWVSTRHERDRVFSLQELADRVNIPERYLRQYFKSNDTCFREWRMGIRIKEVMDMMLKNPDRSVISIARELGFEDGSNFHRQFRRASGCTPKEWRSKNL